jgi:lipopolysaccharide cholinephosphotransferase
MSQHPLTSGAHYPSGINFPNTSIPPPHTQLETFRHYIFKNNFIAGKIIEKMSASNSCLTKNILSRITALFISIICVFLLAADIIHILSNSILCLFYSIKNFQSPLKYTNNYRSITLVAAEFFTHLAGVSFGSILGVISPTTAKKLFLAENQTHLETRSTNMTKEEAGILYGMMEIAHTIFQENGMKYAITAGTVLGKERHGGIIPWDDDIDLLMMNSDANRLEEPVIAQRFNDLGLGIIKCRIGYKIYYKDGKDVSEGDLRYKYPFIDVAKAIKLDDKICYEDELSRKTYAGEYYTLEEWGSIKEVEFGPAKVMGLQDGTNFVSRCYGHHAMDYGFTLLNHKNFTIEFPVKYLLEKQANGMCRPIEYSAESLVSINNKLN